MNSFHGLLDVPRMPLASDLLTQARLLAMHEPRRPRQASLRRAVSTAYYALFHLLIEDAVRLLGPKKPDGLRLLMRRAFDHREMQDVCKSFSQTPAASVRHLLSAPLSAPMKSIARTFVELQKARHIADYDRSVDVTRAEVLSHITNAERAFLDWRAERGTPNAQLFLASLAFNKRWDRRL